MRNTDISTNLDPKIQKPAISTKIKAAIISMLLPLSINSCANMQIRDPAQFNNALKYWNQSQQPVYTPGAPSLNQPVFYVVPR